MTDGRMNVVVVLIDALRQDRIGPNNESTRSKTPHINKIADRGTNFVNAYTTINATDPAITSLHSGRHLNGHGVIHHGSRVSQDEKQNVENVTLFPEVLKNHNLDTYSYTYKGRWHQRGFRNDQDRIHSGLSKFCKAARSLFRLSRDNDIIDSFRAELDAGNQFYSFVHLRDTHIPYNASMDSLHPTTSDDSTLVNLAEDYGYHSWTYDKFHEWSEEYGEDTTPAHIEAMYDEAVKIADNKVGNLIDILTNKNILEDTILVILSDHGESLGEHGIYFDHHGLYDETIKIPMIINHPMIDQVGCVSEFVQITDIAPTILDLINLSHDMSFDGSSLVKHMMGKNDSFSRNAILAEEAHTQRKRMIRTDEYKCIWSIRNNNICRYCCMEHGAETELYNLIDDPNENDNIAGNKPTKVNNLISKFHSIRDDMQKAAYNMNAQVEYPDEQEVLEHLEYLGYR